MDFSQEGKWTFFTCILSLLFLFGDSQTLWAQISTITNVADSQSLPAKASLLTLDDCTICHRPIVKQIEANGGAHGSQVTCQDCHKGHPPTDWEIIPECGMCHSGTVHFNLEGCLNCHTNPHTPLEITLTRDITEACLTCHEDQGKQLRENKSIHSTLDCTACHYQHGQIPACSRCHLPHAAEALPLKCNTCHPAHMPLVINYGAEISSEACKLCHGEMSSLMAASGTKHNELGCAKCHVDKHRMIPECGMCHGVRHSPWLLDKFSGCGECHGIAHNLSTVKKKE